MPATSSVIPGLYRIEFATIPLDSKFKSLYLTSHREGKQLTLEEPTSHANQEWNIRSPSGKDDDLAYRIIAPAYSKDIIAVSQDVVQHPDKVSLIKNLQVWEFSPVPSREDVYLIRSNLYAGIKGHDPLLGTDKESKKVIINQISEIHINPRPFWRFIGPLSEKE